MKNVVALVLAGGRMGNYGVLTLNRAKAALTYAGKYRIIDCALSNLCHSGIGNAGLIIQYLPSSLIEHVGGGQSWDFHGYGRMLRIMPPFVGLENTEWYKGTADALYQNLNFVYDTDPAQVVVLSGEHVYQLDFRPVIESHRERNADITMVTKDMPPERCTGRFGYVVTGDDSKVLRFVEKPDAPLCNTVSTGIYVFDTDCFLQLVCDNAKARRHNLAKDVIERHALGLDCYAYPMPGFWEYLEDVTEYFEAHMRLVKGSDFEMIRHWGIMTNLDYRGVGSTSAAHYGRDARVSDSLVSVGCRIDGTVENSVLSPGVVVSRGAVVRDSILMHGCIVAEGAAIERVVSDKDARYRPGCRVGLDASDGPVTDAEASPDPTLTLVGKGCVICEGTCVPRGIQLRPGTVMKPGRSLTPEEARLKLRP
jgi:glucose-1-phosphate adenylyltransferase